MAGFFDKLRQGAQEAGKKAQITVPRHPGDDRGDCGDRMVVATHEQAAAAEITQDPMIMRFVQQRRLSLLIAHDPAFLSQIPLPPGWKGEQLRRFLAEVSDPAISIFAMEGSLL